MKFAEIVYSQREGNIVSNSFRSVFLPFMAEEIRVLGTDGYRIKLNVNQNADEKSRTRILKKAAAFLNDNGVTVSSGEGFEGVYRADGRTLAALLAQNTVKASDESVIIAGGQALTETALCALCPRISYISLLTDEGYKYAEAAEYFFREYGINIQLIKSFKHENFRNADVIINCGRRTENYDYLLKNGCIYYDIEKDEVRLRRLSRIRGDIRIVRTDIITVGGGKIRTDIAECALYASDINFKKLADSLSAFDLGCAEKLNIIENIELSPLTSN